MTIEQKTESIARRIASERGYPEALWEMFLLDAYHEAYKLPAPDGSFRDARDKALKHITPVDP